MKILYNFVDKTYLLTFFNYFCSSFLFHSIEQNLMAIFLRNFQVSGNERKNMYRKNLKKKQQKNVQYTIRNI